MKKYLLFFLIMILALSLVSCVKGTPTPIFTPNTNGQAIAVTVVPHSHNSDNESSVGSGYGSNGVSPSSRIGHSHSGIDLSTGKVTYMP